MSNARSSEEDSRSTEPDIARSSSVSTLILYAWKCVGKCQHELLCFFFYIANNALNTTYPPPPRQIGLVLQGVQYVSASYALCLFMLVSVTC